MNNSEIEDTQYELSVQAAVNERFHQDRSAHWRFWERSAYLAVSLLTIFGALLSLASVTTDSSGWGYASLACGVVAVVIATAMGFLPMGKWERDHASFRVLWGSIREDVEMIPFMDTVDEKTKALGQAKAKIVRLCKQEPKESKGERELIDRLQNEEEISRKPNAATV